MKLLKGILAILIIPIAFHGNAQSNFSWESGKLLLDNGAIKRTIFFNPENGTVETVALFHEENLVNYVSDETSPEFAFKIDDEPYTGQDQWEYIAHVPAHDDKQGSGVKVTLRGAGALSSLEIDITYMLYPDLPVIRKYITFRNRGPKEIKLESLDVEKMQLSWHLTDCYTYGNYARQPHIGTYIGDWDDALVVVHDFTHRKGIALGNEAHSVTKRTAYHDEYEKVSIGLTHTDQDYAFRKWIEPGDEWTSPQVFIATYDNSTDIYNVVNGTVNDFTRKHMGIRLMEIENKPIFVYNTWNPFRHDINEELICELSDVAAECGIEEFIIDDGWQQNYYPDTVNGGPDGDWFINEIKFPNGLAPVFDHIKANGMKPGLWMTIGSVHKSSKVYEDHKEWFVEDKNGELGNLHCDWEPELITACFGTDWKEYIKSKITGLVKDHGLGYTKLDFAITTSAYVVDPERSGCYSSSHPFHKDHNESFFNNYQRLLDFFDELHREAPDLYIDCTFETAGKMQLIDYAIIKHAEGDWLSNFEEPTPYGPLRVRNMAWWRTPVMPAGACVIGNLALDTEDLEFDLLSTIGTFPIMLGDLRKLSDKEKNTLKAWSGWLREMQERYTYMDYRQDLPAFGEPKEGRWDGWARINTDSKEGGIVGVFRQGAVENSRVVTVSWLDPDQKYLVFGAINQEFIKEMTGRQLETEGFFVSMERPYQAKLFEIRRIPTSMVSWNFPFQVPHMIHCMQ